MRIAIQTCFAAPADDASHQQAGQLVQGPAIGLLITGAVNVLATAVILILIIVWKASYSPLSQVGMQTVHISLTIMILPVLLSLFASSFLVFTALKMMRLEAYRLAIAASILLILMPATAIFGWAIGIWSLVVLSRADVRAAFVQRERRRVPLRPATLTQRRLGAAAPILAIAAVPLSLLLGMSGAWKTVILLFLLLQLTAIRCRHPRTENGIRENRNLFVGFRPADRNPIAG